jgi:hypothetical protein
VTFQSSPFLLFFPNKVRENRQKPFPRLRRGTLTLKVWARGALSKAPPSWGSCLHSTTPCFRIIASPACWHGYPVCDSQDMFNAHNNIHIATHTHTFMTIQTLIHIVHVHLCIDVSGCLWLMYTHTHTRTCIYLHAHPHTHTPYTYYSWTQIRRGYVRLTLDIYIYT